MLPLLEILQLTSNILILCEFLIPYQAQVTRSYSNMFQGNVYFNNQENRYGHLVKWLRQHWWWEVGGSNAEA